MNVVAVAIFSLAVLAVMVFLLVFISMAMDWL